jgi:hypothetical protein
MAVTFLANYRETFTGPTLDQIDHLLSKDYDLELMLLFIDRYSETEFVDFYEVYLELGLDYEFESVDAFLTLYHPSDMKSAFEGSYLGEYQSPERMAEDYFDGETDRMDYRISIDWVETAEYLLQHDVDRVGDFYFRCNW